MMNHMSCIHTHTHARTRNQDGRFRKKRSDTHLETLEKTYPNISDRRGDCHLGTIREASGKSLSQLVHGHHEVTHKPGLHGRVRTQEGRIRAKNGTTHLRTLEATYGDLAFLPGDTHLSVLRAATGGKSLSYLLHHRDQFPDLQV